MTPVPYVIKFDRIVSPLFVGDHNPWEGLPMLADGDNISLDLSVDVDCKELLEILKKNMKKHNDEYAEARVGWHTKVLAQLQRMKIEVAKLLLAVDGVEPATNWQTDQKLPHPGTLAPSDWNDEPVCYTRHYEDAIDMLAMSQNETITLSRTLFKQLVHDEWKWKQRHRGMVMKYSEVG
jgi:hypothetical protein